MGKPTRSEQVIAELAEINPEAIILEGYDEAILGISYRFNMEPVLAYDRAACINKLVLRDGMSAEEAEEYFVFNTEGGWFGEGTPIFIEMPA